MFDKSRELNFPLTGGSSIPTYFRTPEIDLPVDTSIKNSLVVGAPPMREPSSIALTCFKPLSNAARAVRRASISTVHSRP